MSVVAPFFGDFYLEECCSFSNSVHSYDVVVERPRLADEVVVAVNVAAEVVLLAVAVPKLNPDVVEAGLLVGATLATWELAPKDNVGAEVEVALTLVVSDDCVEGGLAVLPRPIPVAVVAADPKFKVPAVVEMANGFEALVAGAAELPRPKENPVAEAVVACAACGADGLNEKLLDVVVGAGAGVVPKDKPDA